MNRDQMKMGLGDQRGRLREARDGLETENWIFGLAGLRHDNTRAGAYYLV